MWIYGKNVIFNCILNGRKIHKILLTQKNYLELEEFLQKNKIKFLKNLIEICDKKGLIRNLRKMSPTNPLLLKLIK